MRLQEHTLKTKYLPHMTFEEKKKGDLVILPSDEQVYIVLNGKVVLREHKLNDPLDFKIVAIVKQG